VSGSVTSATLKLYIQGLPNGSPVPAYVFSVSDDDWTETGITWNNAPAAGSQLDYISDISTVGIYYNFDVTSFVSSEMSGDKVVSLLVKDITEAKMSIDFDRREDSNPPILTVETGGAKEMRSVEVSEIIIPDEMRLVQNYPNPFNPSTTITYSLPVEGHVKLTVYDMKGRLVSTLVNGLQSAGAYTHVWEAVNSDGNQVPSGMYLCRFQVGSHVETIKMMFMR
jgi:hypothetical protein